MADDAAILPELERLAVKAGRAILEIYARDFAVEAKADDSPVTEADREAETVILEGLRASFPNVPVVAEEAVSRGGAPADVGEVFFLVDPLDGTKEFVSRQGDFTVNIALVRGGLPATGAVYAPARGELYSGRPGYARAALVAADDTVREHRPIEVSRGKGPCRIVASRSHRTPETDAFIAHHPGAAIVPVGSSLKFCMVASGAADLYPRFGRTMQWDTAAGDAVLRAAGGRTTTIDGALLSYGPRAMPGEEPFHNPHFIAEGAPDPA